MEDQGNIDWIIIDGLYRTNLSVQFHNTRVTPLSLPAFHITTENQGQDFNQKYILGGTRKSVI